MVISTSDDSEVVFVAYLATFGRRTRLPCALDPVYWVPIRPAECEENDRNIYDPIPSINGVAQWVSIRKRILLKDLKVSMFLFALDELMGVWRTLGDPIHEENVYETCSKGKQVLGRCSVKSR